MHSMVFSHEDPLCSVYPSRRSTEDIDNTWDSVRMYRVSPYLMQQLAMYYIGGITEAMYWPWLLNRGGSLGRFGQMH